MAKREAGVPQTDLRILLVRDTSVRLDHAVLSFCLDGRWLIPDNRFSTYSKGGEIISLPVCDRPSGREAVCRPYAQSATALDRIRYSRRCGVTASSGEETAGL